MFKFPRPVDILRNGFKIRIFYLNESEFKVVVVHDGRCAECDDFGKLVARFPQIANAVTRAKRILVMQATANRQIGKPSVSSLARRRSNIDGLEPEEVEALSPVEVAYMEGFQAQTYPHRLLDRRMEC